MIHHAVQRIFALSTPAAMKIQNKVVGNLSQPEARCVGHLRIRSAGGACPPAGFIKSLCLCCLCFYKPSFSTSTPKPSSTSSIRSDRAAQARKSPRRQRAPSRRRATWPGPSSLAYLKLGALPVSHPCPPCPGLLVCHSPSRILKECQS